METTKPLFASKTVLVSLAGILTALATIAQGFASDPADMSIVSTGIVSLLTAVGAIISRINATKVIE